MDYYNHLASQTLWQLQHWDSAPDDVSVVRVNTIEPWGINRSYTLAVDCYTNEPAQKAWLGSRGSLALAGLVLPFVVSAASTLNEPVLANQPYHVQLIIKAPFWLWHMSRHRRHWVNASSKQIIQQALQAHGMNQHLRWLGDWQTAWPYWLQYHQTDWDCFQQMMALNAGCFLMPPVDQDSPWVLNCARRLDQLRSQPRHWQLPWQPNGGLLAQQIGVYEINDDHTNIPCWLGVASSQAHDSELMQGDVAWSQVSGTYSTQSRVAHWPWLPNHVSLQQLAHQYGQAYQAQLKQQYWRTQAVDIVPGDTIELIDRDQNPITDNYRVIAVSWHADQSSALDHLRATSGHDPVTTQLTVLPVEYSLPCSLPAEPPTLPMTERAWVQSGPDQNGYYQLEDRQAQDGFQKLPPMPVPGFHTGYKSGQHYPLQAGTQVALLTHHQGPAPWQILGCLPQPSQPSPITQDQSGQHLFRTPGGHRWHYYDQAKQYRFDWQHLSKQQGWHWFYDQHNDTDHPALQQWYNHQGPLAVQLGRSSSQTIQGCIQHQANKAYHRSIQGQTRHQYDHNLNLKTTNYRFRNDGRAHIKTPKLNIHSDGSAHLASHGDMILKADKLNGKIGSALWLQSHHTVSLQGNITLKAGSSSCQIQGGSIKVSGQNATLIGHGSGGGGGGDSQSPDPQALPPRKPQHPHHWQLKTAKVQPRWRLAWPEEQLTDLASLIRLPEDLQQSIVTSILKRLTPEQSDQSITLPDSDQWTDWVESSQASTFQQQLQDKLTLDHAPHLNPGFIYVFIQSPQGPRFQQQPYLWQEYAISQPDDDGHVNFTPIKLEHYAGLDERQATGEAQTYIELPYQYRKHLQKQPVQVWVFYSATQLSWPRIQHYGGMDPDDPRPDQVSDPDQRNRLQTIQQQSTHIEALKQRAGQSPTIPQQALQGIAQAQKKPSIIPPKDDPGAGAQAWCQAYAHYTDPNHNQVPYLLLDDPLGYIERGNQLLVNLWRLLKGQLHQIKHTALQVSDQDGQTHQHTYPLAAILAWQLTYGFNAANAVQKGDQWYPLRPEIEANKHPHDHASIDALPWPKAQNQLSQAKLQYVLHKSQRDGLHQLIHQLQQINTEHLLVTWSVKQQSAQKPPYDTFNDPLLAIQDSFAQPSQGFAKGYLLIQGLIGINTADSRELDRKLHPGLPKNQDKPGKPKEAYMGYEKTSTHYISYQALPRSWVLKTDQQIVTRVTREFSQSPDDKTHNDTDDQCHYQLMQSQTPPGLPFIEALHQTSFPLHPCCFPQDSTDSRDTDDLDNPAYLQGQGHFNAQGFSLAWGDVPDLSEQAAASVNDGNNLFRSVISRFVDQSMSRLPEDAQAHQAQDIETMLAHFDNTQQQYYDLLQHGTGVDYRQQIKLFQDGAKHTHELKHYHAHGDHIPDDPMPKRSNRHLQHWLHISTQVSGVITLTLTIWDQVHQQLKQDDKRQQTPLYIATAIGMTKLGGTVAATHSGLQALLGEGKVDHWLNNSHFDSFLSNMSNRWASSELQVTDLIERWGFIADVFDFTTSTLNLINTITGRGLTDTNQLVSDLFDTAGHALIAGGEVKKLTDNAQQELSQAGSEQLGEQEESIKKHKEEGSSASTEEAAESSEATETTAASEEGGEAASEASETGVELLSEGFEVGEVAEASVEVLSVLTPADIVIAIGFGCCVVANVLELFKHNQFQIWAENSVFNQDTTSYTPWVKQPDNQYHALLQLLVIPHMHCDKKATLPNSDQQAIKCTMSLNSIEGILSPHQIRQLQVAPYIKEREHEEVGTRLPNTMPMNQTVDQEEHVLSQSAATQAHYDTDEAGLPVQVLYYSYSDLGLALSKSRPNKHMKWINVLFYPACQLQLNTGHLPTSVAFPNSKGYADMTLNWLGSWLPGGQSKQFTQFKEQHWVGDPVKIIEINQKMDED